nr:MAG TPA: hypothetical protein [Caudoviricetes sp.]
MWIEYLQTGAGFVTNVKYEKFVTGTRQRSPNVLYVDRVPPNWGGVCYKCEI